MADEITLEALIDQVKIDLFAKYSPSQRGTRTRDPLFFIESVELELVVAIKRERNAGIKVTLVPQFVEGSVGGHDETGRTHTVKIKLAPIVPLDKQRELIEQDVELADRIRENTVMALRRGSQIAGEEE